MHLWPLAKFKAPSLSLREEVFSLPGRDEVGPYGETYRPIQASGLSKAVSLRSWKWRMY